MKTNIFTLLMLTIFSLSFAQIDKEQLALNVSKTDAANTEKLKAFIWKRYSTATVNGEVKATVITEFSFDTEGKLQVKQIDAESTVKDKRGIRGRIQDNAMEDNAEYVEKALQLALNYTHMSKGSLLDFFEKAVVTEVGSIYYEITGKNVLMEGDLLTLVVEKETLLFMSMKFSSKVDSDPVEGTVSYEKFSSGINHVANTTLKLAAKNAVINAKNQDYSQRIN
jgi:pyruvate formate-lyase activating enzyme-like uncharacterized protein